MMIASLVPLDADFHAYLALSGAIGPSVVRIRIEGLQGAALTELLTKAWPNIKHAIDSGAMVTITHNTLRIRTLPVKFIDLGELLRGLLQP
jgi:predicted nuclease of predicted toxin-antitoxin system